MRLDPQVLFDDYLHWRGQTSSIRKREAAGLFTAAPKVTQDRLALFDRVITWCDERDLDPRLWVYVLFKRMAWMYPPKLLPGYLMSEKAIERYHQCQDTGPLQRRIAETSFTRPYDPNVDLSPSVEAQKARLAGEGHADLCLAGPEFTLGYHPRSEVCLRCPLAADCASDLQRRVGFDIQALRLGQMTPETAALIAQRRGL